MTVGRRTGTRPAVWVALLLLILVLVGCGSPEEPVSFLTVDTDPDWSPDGQLIAFASSRRLGGLFVIRPDGTGLRQLFHGNASNPDWSPDGRRIAYQGSSGIYLISRHGGRPRHILRGARFLLPAWAPDGRMLAVVKWERDLSMAIYVLRPDGSGLERLLPQDRRSPGSLRSGAAASATEPAWAPNGRQIAFQEGNGRIVVVKIAGERRRLIATGSDEPAWSPDGRTIAFESNGALWATNADGSGDPHLLASNGADPSWAPDSRNMVFEVRHWFGRFSRRPQSLSVVDAEGTSLRKLTYGGSVYDDPGWRGDRATP
jgi:Tol biopolymer transport system component